jgi:hypothetical protein
MEAGRLPYVKIGRRRVIPKKSLVEWLASNVRGGWAIEEAAK